jgi:nonribosomal peptide synthetase DhbF
LPIRPHGSLQPLFCIHPGGGFSWIYSRLIRHIPAGHPIYGLQARILLQREIFPASIEEMAADYLSVIREVQPVGPYNLLGLSFGGLVAHAIATRLQSVGEKVALLALLDSFPREHDESHYRHMENEMGAHFTNGGDRPIKDMLDALHREGHILSTLEEHHYNVITDAMRKSTRLIWTFSPQRFHGDLVLFVNTRDEIKPSTEVWRPFVEGQIEVHQIDCTHQTMMEPVPAAEIGSVLATELTKQRATPTSMSKESVHGHQSV